MKFNGDGYLAAGLHPTTLADIKAHLVDTFPFTSTRPKVYAGYVRHTNDLQKVSMTFNQFLDGSFVSSKDDPGDIDLLCMGDQATLDALDPTEQALLTPLFLGAAPSRLTTAMPTFSQASPIRIPPTSIIERNANTGWGSSASTE